MLREKFAIRMRCSRGYRRGSRNDVLSVMSTWSFSAQRNLLHLLNTICRDDRLLDAEVPNR